LFSSSSSDEDTDLSSSYEEREATDVLSDDEEEDYDDDVLSRPVQLPSEWDAMISAADVLELTVPQLKQQLRLRNLKVSGRKLDLQNRLCLAIGARSPSISVDGDFDDDDSPSSLRGPTSTPEHFPAATAATATQSNQDIDRQRFSSIEEEYLEDPDDRGRHVKSFPVGESRRTESKDEGNPAGDDDQEAEDGASSSVEVWGLEARIVDDYEGRQLVVDGLSRTRVEFAGSNQSIVQAYCVASRDALKPFLSGSGLGTGSNGNRTRNFPTSAEERLRKIQRDRERASRRAWNWDDEVGVDEGDETGIFKNVLDRDYSDWGKYTPTGAQLSAGEVKGVLLLSDVYGAFTDDIQSLADKIAFECQPAVVLVPDLFEGVPWTPATTSASQRNDQGQSYEQWRARYCSDLRVSVDIRAAAACLRERYGCSSVVVWGMCYGGGRALEAASGWLPNGIIHDVDGSIGPPPVNPMAAVAWYPTRYNANSLFGTSHSGTIANSDGTKRQIAVMAVFAGKDSLPGATPEDAEVLQGLLEHDERVKDHMVKIFPEQNHGFAHRSIGQVADGDLNDPYERFVDDEFGGAGRVSVGSNDADVACLLSTAFMETYSRVFLPTVGPPISLDEEEEKWGRNLEMKDLSDSATRDIRHEIQEAMDNFVEEPLLSGNRIDPTDPSQEEQLKKLLSSMQDPSAESGANAILPDDDLPTVYAKLIAQDDHFQIF
jgi:dienelactone hydrolase